MPTFKTTLSPEDVTAIVAYLKSLSGGGEGEKEEKEEKEEEGEASAARKGEKLAETLGCQACHSSDGSARVGPSFKGLYGRQVELADGGKVTADEAYIRESIARPKAKVVKGFSNVMPDFEGKITEEDLSAIIVYIKTLKH
jgi:cytochrome c oxidase subunit 2